MRGVLSARTAPSHPPRALEGFKLQEITSNKLSSFLQGSTIIANSFSSFLTRYHDYLRALRQLKPKLVLSLLILQHARRAVGGDWVQ